jgi:hypothetical protein
VIKLCSGSIKLKNRLRWTDAAKSPSMDRCQRPRSSHTSSFGSQTKWTSLGAPVSVTANGALHHKILKSETHPCMVVSRGYFSAKVALPRRLWICITHHCYDSPPSSRKYWTSASDQTLNSPSSTTIDSFCRVVSCACANVPCFGEKSSHIFTVPTTVHRQQWRLSPNIIISSIWTKYDWIHLHDSSKN